MHGCVGGGKMVNRKRLYPLIYLCCLFYTWGWSTEFQPWVGNYFEFEWRNTLLYQTYPVINSNSQRVKYSSSDFFFTTSLSNALKPEFSIELEAALAYTRHQKGNIDNFRLTGRYMWLDDLLGDRISLTTGVKLTQSFLNSLHDISSFHHGRAEAEFFISLGQEESLETKWGSRWWVVGGIGVANRGSAWLHAQSTYEFRLLPKHEVRLFGEGLLGLGHKQLPIHHFHGYGPIQHRSLDLGIRYTYLIDFFGSASFEYSNRVYARNFPAQAHRFLLNLLYTFGP
jgi:hypothetical protein